MSTVLQWFAKQAHKALALFAADRASGPEFLGYARFRGPTSRKRDRVPHSNEAKREREGIPHGTPGAKLARQALEGRLTKKW